MPNSEIVKPTPTFEVEKSRIGVELNVFHDRVVPHADLIQAMMNAGACSAFCLKPSWNTEGGVEGIYKKTYIGFENWGEEGKIGILNTVYEAMPYLEYEKREAIEEVLGYYSLFLTQMFEQPIRIEGQWYPPEVFLVKPELQTREAVWNKVMEGFRDVGGGKFPKQVKAWLINEGEASRRYLRGLTDEEVQRFFIEPPLG